MTDEITGSFACCGVVTALAPLLIVVGSRGADNVDAALVAGLRKAIYRLPCRVPGYVLRNVDAWMVPSMAASTDVQALA